MNKSNIQENKWKNSWVQDKPESEMNTLHTKFKQSGTGKVIWKVSLLLSKTNESQTC